MQHTGSRRFVRLVAAGLVVMALASANVMAAGGLPASGLGQSWPNATDVSASPRWHVYVFERNGVRYVQINDLGGKVRAAFASSGGNFLALPLGVDATRLATPEEPLVASGQTQGDIVYQDASTRVLVAPQADGTARVYAANGDCKDPIECSSRIQ
ncbi:hypothetical protein [Dyella amyloliquefaciens]|uniref:hypothetical protein n=1 Tax=Dyella amyloliquefaciens TaxID=1770545 RepID=UPI00102E775C|nr:hypothetical protein [Dyella amyloliquefaciens]